MLVLVRVVVPKVALALDFFPSQIPYPGSRGQKSPGSASLVVPSQFKKVLLRIFIRTCAFLRLLTVTVPRVR
jgi:hypothetical protein